MDGQLGGWRTIQFPPEIVEVYLKDIDLLPGEGRKKIRPVQPCTHRRLFLRDIAPPVPVHRRQTHVLYKLVRCTSQRGDCFAGNVERDRGHDEYGRTGKIGLETPYDD